MAAVPPSHASQLRRAPAFPPTPHLHQQLLNLPVTQERDTHIRPQSLPGQPTPTAGPSRVTSGSLLGNIWGSCTAG